MNNKYNINYSRIYGLTLIELMLSLALGLILILVLGNLFISTIKTRNEIEKNGQQIENGRYALQVLIDDISNAGFFGGANITDVKNQTDYCAANDADKEINKYILKPYLAIPGTVPSCITDIKSGTNLIVIRRFTTSQLATSGTSSAPVCSSEYTCVQIGQDGNPTFLTGTVTEKLASGEWAAVRIPLQNIYYIDANNVLKRKTLTWNNHVATVSNTSESIADGIEKIFFTQSGSTVKIELLARNSTATPGIDNKTYIIGGNEYTPTEPNIRRQYYSAVVNVYNPLD